MAQIINQVNQVKQVPCPLCLGNRKLPDWSASVLGNAAPVACPECAGVGSVTHAQAEVIRQRMADQQRVQTAAAAGGLFRRE